MHGEGLKATNASILFPHLFFEFVLSYSGWRFVDLAIGSLGGITVTQYLETSDPDIYAGGDCVENTNLVTGNKMLAEVQKTIGFNCELVTAKTAVKLAEMLGL